MKNLSDVLVVSESETLRTLVKFALGRWWGVVIRNADSHAAASAALDERTPQLAILDMALPSAGDLGPAIAQKTRIVAVNALGPVSWAHESADPPFQPQKLHAAIEGLSD